MARIKDKLRVVELYAGTGRSIEPYRARPEFEVALLTDISAKARDAYLSNHKDAPYALMDLEKASAAAIKRAAGGRVDILLGCPPCQGFSESGQRRADDPRNDHIVKFARTIRTLRPVGFAMENVPLAAISPQFAAFREIVEGAGYEMAAAVLNAAEYGSAQARQRLVVVGRRGRGSGTRVTLPRPTHQPLGEYFDYALGEIRRVEERDESNPRKKSGANGAHKKDRERLAGDEPEHARREDDREREGETAQVSPDRASLCFVHHVPPSFTPDKIAAPPIRPGADAGTTWRVRRRNARRWPRPSCGLTP